MLGLDRRGGTSTRRGMTVLGKIPAVPKPINLPSQRLENRGLDPNVEIVPRGTVTWGTSTATGKSPPSSSTSATGAWGQTNNNPQPTQNAWGAPSTVHGGQQQSVSENFVTGPWPEVTASISMGEGRPDSGGSGSRPSSAGARSDRVPLQAPPSNSWGQVERPATASAVQSQAAYEQTSQPQRPHSAEARHGPGVFSGGLKNGDGPPLTASTLGPVWNGGSKRLVEDSHQPSRFQLSGGDFPTLGSEKNPDLRPEAPTAAATSTEENNPAVELKERPRTAEGRRVVGRLNTPGDSSAEHWRRDETSGPIGSGSQTDSWRRNSNLENEPLPGPHGAHSSDNWRRENTGIPDNWRRDISGPSESWRRDGPPHGAFGPGGPPPPRGFPMKGPDGPPFGAHGRFNPGPFGVHMGPGPGGFARPGEAFGGAGIFGRPVGRFPGMYPPNFDGYYGPHIPNPGFGGMDEREFMGMGMGGPGPYGQGRGLMGFGPMMGPMGPPERGPRFGPGGMGGPAGGVGGPTGGIGGPPGGMAAKMGRPGEREELFGGESEGVDVTRKEDSEQSVMRFEGRRGPEYADEARRANHGSGRGMHQGQIWDWASASEEEIGMDFSQPVFEDEPMKDTGVRFNDKHRSSGRTTTNNAQDVRRAGDDPNNSDNSSSKESGQTERVSGRVSERVPERAPLGYDAADGGSGEKLPKSSFASIIPLTSLKVVESGGTERIITDYASPGVPASSNEGGISHEPLRILKRVGDPVLETGNPSSETSVSASPSKESKVSIIQPEKSSSSIPVNTQEASKEQTPKPDVQDVSELVAPVTVSKSGTREVEKVALRVANEEGQQGSLHSVKNVSRKDISPYPQVIEGEGPCLKNAQFQVSDPVLENSMGNQTVKTGTAVEASKTNLQNVEQVVLDGKPSLDTGSVETGILSTEVTEVVKQVLIGDESAENISEYVSGRKGGSEEHQNEFDTVANNDGESGSSGAAWDYNAQRAKLKENAQRAKQVRRAEEERMKEQKARAQAKLEELERRRGAGGSEEQPHSGQELVKEEGPKVTTGTVGDISGTTFQSIHSNVEDKQEIVSSATITPALEMASQQPVVVSGKDQGKDQNRRGEKKVAPLRGKEKPGHGLTPPPPGPVSFEPPLLPAPNMQPFPFSHPQSHPHAHPHIHSHPQAQPRPRPPQGFQSVPYNRGPPGHSGQPHGPGQQTIGAHRQPHHVQSPSPSPSLASALSSSHPLIPGDPAVQEQEFPRKQFQGLPSPGKQIPRLPDQQESRVPSHSVHSLQQTNFKNQKQQLPLPAVQALRGFQNDQSLQNRQNHQSQLPPQVSHRPQNVVNHQPHSQLRHPPVQQQQQQQPPPPPQAQQQHQQTGVKTPVLQSGQSQKKEGATLHDANPHPTVKPSEQNSSATVKRVESRKPIGVGERLEEGETSGVVNEVIGNRPKRGSSGRSKGVKHKPKGGEAISQQIGGHNIDIVDSDVGPGEVIPVDSRIARKDQTPQTLLPTKSTVNTQSVGQVSTGEKSGSTSVGQPLHRPKLVAESGKPFSGEPPRHTDPGLPSMFGEFHVIDNHVHNLSRTDVSHSRNVELSAPVKSVPPPASQKGPARVSNNHKMPQDVRVADKIHQVTPEDVTVRPSTRGIHGSGGVVRTGTNPRPEVSHENATLGEKEKEKIGRVENSDLGSKRSEVQQELHQPAQRSRRAEMERYSPKIVHQTQEKVDTGGSVGVSGEVTHPPSLATPVIFINNADQISKPSQVHPQQWQQTIAHVTPSSQHVTLSTQHGAPLPPAQHISPTQYVSSAQHIPQPQLQAQHIPQHVRPPSQHVFPSQQIPSESSSSNSVESRARPGTDGKIEGKSPKAGGRNNGSSGRRIQPRGAQNGGTLKEQNGPHVQTGTVPHTSVPASQSNQVTPSRTSHSGQQNLSQQNLNSQPLEHPSQHPLSHPSPRPSSQPPSQPPPHLSSQHLPQHHSQHISQHPPQFPLPLHPSSQHPPQHPSHPSRHLSQHTSQHPHQHPSQIPSQYPFPHPSQFSQNPPQHPQSPPQHPPQPVPRLPSQRTNQQQTIPAQRPSSTQHQNTSSHHRGMGQNPPSGQNQSLSEKHNKNPSERHNQSMSERQNQNMSGRHNQNISERHNQNPSERHGGSMTSPSPVASSGAPQIQQTPKNSAPSGGGGTLPSQSNSGPSSHPGIAKANPPLHQVPVSPRVDAHTGPGERGPETGQTGRSGYGAGRAGGRGGHGGGMGRGSYGHGGNRGSEKEKPRMVIDATKGAVPGQVSS